MGFEYMLSEKVYIYCDDWMYDWTYDAKGMGAYSDRLVDKRKDLHHVPERVIRRCLCFGCMIP